MTEDTERSSRSLSLLNLRNAYIAIPKTSTKAELAKSFIKLMISDYGCETFLKNSNALLAYDWDSSSYQTSSNYVSSLLLRRYE